MQQFFHYLKSLLEIGQKLFSSKCFELNVKNKKRFSGTIMEKKKTKM